MVRSELDSDSLLGNHLIRLFSLCGSLLEVNQAFCQISNPDVFTWSAIISAENSCPLSLWLLRVSVDIINNTKGRLALFKKSVQ